MAINPPSAEEMARNVVAVEKVRARNLDGTLKADDSSTPDVNEAWKKSLLRKNLLQKRRASSCQCLIFLL
jgi:hypothetical protein